MFIKRSSPDVTLEEWSRLLNNLEDNIMKIEEDIKKIKKILNIEDKPKKQLPYNLRFG